MKRSYELQAKNSTTYVSHSIHWHGIKSEDLKGCVKADQLCALAPTEYHEGAHYFALQYKEQPKSTHFNPQLLYHGLPLLNLFLLSFQFRLDLEYFGAQALVDLIRLSQFDSAFLNSTSFPFKVPVKDLLSPDFIILSQRKVVTLRLPKGVSQRANIVPQTAQLLCLLPRFVDVISQLYGKLSHPR